jgi:hypothetical protein
VSRQAPLVCQLKVTAAARHVTVQLGGTSVYSGTTIPSSGSHCLTLAGGSRLDIKHKNYVALHINLLVIYISYMKSRQVVPLLTRQHGLLKRRFQL